MTRYAVVGHIEWVEFLRVPRVPGAGEIVHAHERWAGPGGGGAVAAAQLLRLAGDVTLFTALGNDTLGQRTRAALEDAGIEVQAVHRATETRRGVVHVDASGERTITVVGERLGPRGSDDLEWERLEEARAVYVTAGDRDALDRSRACRVVVATSRIAHDLERWGGRLDALVGSATDPSERYEPGAIVPVPSVVVLTEGGDGGRFSVGGGSWRRYPPVSLPQPIADRYGAGDSFAGGLTFALGEGLDLLPALALAARCGAEAVTRRGPLNLALPTSG